MDRPKTLIRASSEPWSYDVVLRIGRRGEDGQLYAMQPPVVSAVKPGEHIQPTLTLPREDAQLLMDELWNAGLRPSEGTGSAGAMAATERHLKDMTTIAMGALKKAGVV
jgi:hypothetical protein